MGFFTRDRAEKVVEYHSYPEPAFITRRPRLAWQYRFWLGRPMDGVRWSNSTFWSAGSRGEASWWLRLAGYQRVLYRLLMVWGALMLPVVSALLLFSLHGALLKLLLLHLVATAPVLLVLQLLAVREHGLRVPMLQRVPVELNEEQERALAGADAPERRVFALTWVREGRQAWQREVVEPLAMALADSLDNVFRPGDTDWITVPRNYLEPGGGKVEILLPTGFSGSMNAKRLVLEKAIANKLGMLDPIFDWQLQGRRPRVLVSAPPVPPKVALFRDYARLLEQTEEFRPFLGVGALAGKEQLGALVSAEMVSDSPHIGLSAGTGAGKSMMTRAVIMQALRWGWGVVILDWKAESHSWAKGLQGVRYCVTEEAIHDELERIGQEVDIRKNEGMAGRANVLIVCEEWNMTAALLSEYWSARRSMADQEEKRTMPLRSPALRGFGSLTFAGRQFGLFAFLIAQRMSNRVFNGNTDLRENFQIRMMARYSPQTWRMLIGSEIKPLRKPKELGRWVVWAQDEITVVQGILISDEEAREFASGGEPNPLTPFSSSYGIEPGDAATQRHSQEAMDRSWLGNEVASDATGLNRPAIELPAAPAPALRSLVDLSTSLEYLGITHNMLRNAARADGRGDPNFPKVKGGNPRNGGYLYDRTEVHEWAKKKRAAEAARKAAR